MHTRLIIASALLTALAAASGCGGRYYRVQDTSTGTFYYAEKVQTLRSGEVRFTDAITGEEVTLLHYTFRDLSTPKYKEELEKEKARREAQRQSDDG